jgi:hypothetical protein
LVPAGERRVVLAAAGVTDACALQIGQRSRKRL